MRICLFIFFLVAASFAVRAQDARADNTPAESGNFPKKLTGRVNFLGLLDGFDRNISAGAEYRFHPHWSAGMDAGYIFNSRYIIENIGVQGLIVRPFIRYYFKENGTGFLESHVHYKSASYKVKDWIGRDVVDGIPSYEEYSEFHFDKRIFGLSVMIGDKFNLIKENDHLQFEPYLGIGVRHKKQQTNNGFYSPQMNWSEFLRPEYTFTAVLMGIRLTFKW